jgi:Domain of unknown function (DUF4388)
MAMIGDLQSFTLPDLLRTLGKSRQSGQLSIWAKNGVYRLWLNQGAVSAAIAPHLEGTLKTLCLTVMNQSYGLLLRPLRAATTVLSEPLGDWVRQRNWLTEDECLLVFQMQLNTGLYPLFELASGQFYFVADKAPLPYWEMTGLELLAMEAIAQGLALIDGKTIRTIDLPPLDLKFLALSSTTTAFRLSLLDRRLLQWFKQPNTIQSLCQVLNVEPLELQKACKRLLHLQMIKVANSNSSSIPLPLPQSELEEDVLQSSQEIFPPVANYSLVQRIAAVLNTPVVGRSNRMQIGWNDREN